MYPVTPFPSRARREEFLQTLSRDNLQLLVNELFQLDATSSDIGSIAILPQPTTPIPRAKPVFIILH